MAVRSNRLAVGSFSDAAGHVIYTCPASTRTIVKYATTMNAGAAGRVIFTVTPTSGSAAIFALDLAATGAVGSSVHTELWVVLRAGDTLSITYPSASGGWHTVSGTELAL